MNLNPNTDRETLEAEFEAAIAGDHRACYEGELDCPELDSLVDMVAELPKVECVNCPRNASHLSSDLEQSPRCEYHRIFIDAGEVSFDVRDRAFTIRRGLIDSGVQTRDLSAAEIVSTFYLDGKPIQKKA